MQFVCSSFQLVTSIVAPQCVLYGIGKWLSRITAINQHIRRCRQDVSMVREGYRGACSVGDIR